jgi:MFS family permease
MTAVAATASRTHNSFKDVWLISAGHGITHWYTASFYILLPLLAAELHLSYTQIGMTITVQYLAGALANIPGGMIVDVVGKKGYIMAVALFWVGMPYALMSLTHHYAVLLMCAALVGIGNNLWHPAAISTLAQRYPDRKGLVLSFHGMGGNLSEAVAPSTVAALLTWLSWRTVVVINVVPGVIMSALILGMLGAFSARTVGTAGNADPLNDRAKVGSRKVYLRDVTKLLRNKSLMLVSCSSALRTMTQAGIFTFLPVFLFQQLHYSQLAIGLCISALSISGFLAAPVGGYLSDRIGRKRVVMSSTLLTGTMIIGMLLVGKNLLFVLFVALVGFFLYAMRSVLQAWAVESVPKQLAGAGIGVQFGFTSFGAAISPAFLGLVADKYTIYGAFYLLAGTIILGNLFMAFLPDRAAGPNS